MSLKSCAVTSNSAEMVRANADLGMECEWRLVLLGHLTRERAVCVQDGGACFLFRSSHASLASCTVTHNMASSVCANAD